MMHMQDLDLYYIIIVREKKTGLPASRACIASHDSCMARRSIDVVASESDRDAVTSNRRKLLSYAVALVPTWKQLVHTHADMHGYG
jgi:hypothetical protein